MPAPPNDDSIIDITGLFQRLSETNTGGATASTAGTYTQIAPNFYHYEAPTLGSIYGQKLGLTKRQTGWLNKFYLPTNGFLTIEAGRQATVLLYTTALLAVEQQLKPTGTTLAREVGVLEQKAKTLRYHSHSWYYGSTKGDKTGADIYLAAFRQCENAVRRHFDYSRKEVALFGKQLAELLPDYQQRLGRHIQGLLPGLIAQVPPPDEATEILLNTNCPTRWKSRFAQLLPLLPTKISHFGKAVEKLAAQNARNHQGSTLLFEAAKLLLKLDREAALRLYVQHVAQELEHIGAERHVKPWPKMAQKTLFPLPEHQERFEVLLRQLEFDHDLKAALRKLPTIYEVQRKKIELDKSAIHAVRDQHAGTVELLNEYLRDEPAPTPATAPTQAAPATKGSKPAKASRKAPAGAPAASPFAPALGLTATQQALLLLFANQQLTLPQAEIEAFAGKHGTLRNQLIDGLNDACYELLDDVLIEESGDEYSIYPPHYQKLIH